MYTAFGLVILLWILDRIALAFSLYWTIGWYDYMMHFLGGFIVAVLVFWFLGLGEKSLKSFWIVFALVIIIGVGWEIFEYLNDLTFSTQTYALDTTLDILMDALGGIVAYWWTTSPSQQSS